MDCTQIIQSRDSNSGFRSERVPSASFTEKDIIGPMVLTNVDAEGNEIRRYAEYKDKILGFIDDDDYQKFYELSERVLTHNKNDRFISREFLVRNLFDYLIHLSNEIEFCEYLERQATPEIRKHIVWVPIHNLYLDKDFSFGGAQFRTISKALFESAIVARMNGRAGDPALFDAHVARLRKDLQGIVAAEISLEAEYHVACQRAFEQTLDAVALLHIFWPFQPAITIHSPVTVDRRSREISQETITFFEPDGLKRNRHSLEKQPVWHLSLAHYTLLKRYFHHASDLFLNTKTDFRKSLLKSLLLFGGSFQRTDVEAKLMFILSAIESMLLKDRFDSIQQIIGERLAFAVSTNVAERQRIVKCTKKVYAVRSSVVHHGELIRERQAIAEFIGTVNGFFLTMLDCLDQFQTKEDFLHHLDQIKYS